MAKNNRPPLEIDELSENLKKSSGRGADAFFSSPTPVEAQPKPKTIKENIGHDSPTPSATQPSNQSTGQSTPKSNIVIKQESNKESNITSNITILQITEKDIDLLRVPTSRVQSFRLPEWATEYLRDASYKLSKENKRGKIGQGDILSIGVLLFDKFSKSNKNELKELLERIK